MVKSYDGVEICKLKMNKTKKKLVTLGTRMVSLQTNEVVFKSNKHQLTFNIDRRVTVNVLHFRKQPNPIQLVFSFYDVVIVHDSNQKVKKIAIHDRSNYSKMKHMHSLCMYVDFLSKLIDITKKGNQWPRHEK